MPAAGQSLDFNVVSGSVPQDFNPSNWQQVADTFASRLQISLNQAYALFNIGSVLPTSNQGPFLLNGLQWYVWSNDLAEYIPMPLAQSQLMFFIGNAAPDPTIYKIWWQTDSNGNAVAPNWFNPKLGVAGQWQPFGYSTGQVDAFFPGTDTVTGFKQVNFAQILNMPPFLASGTTVGNTAARPASPQNYQFYFDTDIGALLMYYGGGWHTVSGSPGDVKFVKAATLVAALAQNPGWVQNTDATDRVLIAAGNLYAENTTGGLASTTLLQNQLPGTLSGLTLTGASANGNGGIATFWGAASNAGNLGMASAGITNPGGSQPLALLPPYIAYWCLIKS